MRWIPLMLGLIVSALMSGCSSGRPLAKWQDELENYVVEYANGDLNAVRDLEAAQGRAGYATIGAASSGFSFLPRKRSDVVGVLLGAPTINDRCWFIFLVGTTEYRGEFAYLPLDHATVREVRLAAVCSDGVNLNWAMGPESPSPTSIYRMRLADQWMRLNPEVKSTREARVVFPAGDDQFELTMNAQDITVMERRSNAKWSMPLGAFVIARPR